jgi:lipoyl(octanoyl) transferase
MSKKCNYNIEWRVEKNLVKYDEALKFMEQTAQEIIEEKRDSLIWVLEHYPVYTAGISAKDEDLLDNKNIEVFKINRGGKYTYHCPGMKIIYVLLNLKKLFYPAKPDISRFVEFLEMWIIAVLKNYQIEARIRKGRVGLWVETATGEKKISAIGIKIKKWVSYHGIALNINPDLAGFNNIVPCGIKEFGITSFSQLGIENFDEENFSKILKKEFENLQKIFFNS